MKKIPDVDSNFIFISFYDAMVFAAIMITFLVLAFLILDQAYFENNVILRVHEVIQLQKLKQIFFFFKFWLNLVKSLCGCNSAIMGSYFLSKTY